MMNSQLQCQIGRELVELGTKLIRTQQDEVGLRATEAYLASLKSQVSAILAVSPLLADGKYVTVIGPSLHIVAE